MANGTNAPLPTRPARNGEPQPAPPPNASEPATAKRDLTSWWKQFSKRSAVRKEEEKDPEPRGIFGVPLITSIPYANVAISLFNETGESYIYGYVPIVVAKCGVFLKEKATDVEGIFRLAGSEKRIKELRNQFDTPPRWGKGLDWTGYTVHDAANILRRYFNQLPEPIIPLQHYDPFRQPLRGHQAEAVGPIEGQAPSVGGFDPDQAVRVYQHLIKELPSLNRQLLLYILDLLAVFAAKSDVNKMTTSNLAAIFQPGILSHPQHDMAPHEYRLSQDVLIFLIDNQDHFLIGMEGTAVDERTAKHVESGPSTPQVRTPTTPGRNKSGLGRSASAASSAAAESIRKFGGVRRNVSTSSRQSRHSPVVPSPTTPSFVTPGGSTSVHRSNTVPSKRSPALRGSSFTRDRGSDPPTPAVEDISSPLAAAPPQDTSVPEPATPSLDPPRQSSIVAEKLDVVRPIQGQTITLPQQTIELSKPTPTDVPGAYPLPSPGFVPPSNNDLTPVAPAAISAAQALAPPTPQRQGRPSPQVTPTREKSEFIEGPVDSGPSIEPAPAVRTFTQILSKVSPSADEKKDGRKPNKLQKRPKIPSSANPSAHSSTHSLSGAPLGFDAPPSPLPYPLSQHNPVGSREVIHSHPPDTASSRHSGATLKPTMSPSASFRSHSTATEYSETEQHNEEPPKEEKRSFWRHKRNESKATPTASQTDLPGNIPGAEKSMSSIGSSSGWGGRRSLQFDSHQAPDPSTLYGASPEKEQEKKGAFSWFREKRQEHKDREAKKQRAKSPPGSSSDLIAQQHLGRLNPHEALPVRGKSMDIPRNTAEGSSSKDSNDITPTGTANPALPNSGQLQAPTNLAPQASANPLTQTPANPVPQASAASALPQTSANQVLQASANPGPQAPTNPIPQTATNPVSQAPTNPASQDPTNPVPLAQPAANSTTQPPT